MGSKYASLGECVLDLERAGHLVSVQQEVEPNLEMAAVARRAYAAGGPAVLFKNVKGSPFPAVCNLFGTLERGRYIFRDTLASTAAAIGLRAHPERALANPWKYRSAPALRPAVAAQRSLVRPDLRWANPGCPSSRRSRAGPRRRRTVRHASPGLLRDAGRPCCDAEQPWHVPHSVRRERVRARRGSWAALPDPSWDRGAPLGRAGTGRASARQRVHWRTAGSHLRGRDAAPRGPQ